MPGLWAPAKPYNITDLLHPWRVAAEGLAPVGGATFLYSVFLLSVLLYTWWHTRSAYAAGAITLTFATLGLAFPQVRLAAWLFFVLGAALIMFRIYKEVVG